MRKALALLFFACATVSASAQEPARFFIERIDVRGARHVSRDVIVAESRLREAREYTEPELAEAANRVTRAPYLLSADFALEKGSERGRYVLVINVNETKPFFYLLEGVPILATDPKVRTEVDDVVLASDNAIVLGFRFFVGRRGEIHFGLEGADDNRSDTEDYTSYVAGYTQYGVFGTRAFITLNAKKPTDANGRHATVEPQIAAGIPLSLNQTITLEYDRTSASRSGQHPTSLLQRVATARWSYNTTNHPLLPTRGTYLSFGPAIVSTDRFAFSAVDAPPIVHSRLRSIGVEAGAARWWEIAERNSAGAGISSGVSRTHLTRTQDGAFVDRHDDARFITVDLSIAHSFWPAERVAKEGDSRLQLNIRGGPRLSATPPANEHVRQASMSYIRRTSWGLVRIGAGYGW